VTVVRLAAVTRGGSASNIKALGNWPEDNRPAILESYYYLDAFRRYRDKYTFRSWSMDSGAFSAAKSGKVIVPEEYYRTCTDLLATDPLLVEVFSLDVIGDPEASARNTEAMWALGIEAIPTFHYGSPVEALVEMARVYPKISLGGAVGIDIKEKIRWAEACFAHVWPKLIHGLGFGSEDLMMRLPFDSTDASSWNLAPNAFGTWPSFGGSKYRLRGGQKNLRPEVVKMMDVEKRVQARWAAVLAPLRAEVGR